MKKITHGFTLIEIMIVITIASLLAAGVYASFSGARTNAVNKSIKSELKEMQLAIELYKAQNGQYPPAQDISIAGCSDNVSGVSISDSEYCAFNPVVDGLVPEFTLDFFDPDTSANSNCHLIYQVESANGAWYKLVAENCFAGAASSSDGVQSNDEMARCPSTCASTGNCVATSPAYYESYSVYSQGGECM